MKNGFSSVLIFILVLAVFLIAGGSYYFGTQKNSGTIPTPIPEQKKVGSDKDEHGCIGSAGYSWCEIKQKCLRSWEEICNDITPVPTVDETATLKSAIKTALVAKHGDSANELNITVSKVEGNYSSGGASVPGQGGGMWFSAKVNGTWQLVWDGNGIILCTDLTAYPNFPVTMIPECYNEKTNKNIIR